jgi:hypothetical protein
VLSLCIVCYSAYLSRLLHTAVARSAAGGSASDDDQDFDPEEEDGDEDMEGAIGLDGGPMSWGVGVHGEWMLRLQVDLGPDCLLPVRLVAAFGYLSDSCSAIEPGWCHGYVDWCLTDNEEDEILLDENGVPLVGGLPEGSKIHFVLCHFSNSSVLSVVGSVWQSSACVPSVPERLRREASPLPLPLALAPARALGRDRTERLLRWLRRRPLPRRPLCRPPCLLPPLPHSVRCDRCVFLSCFLTEFMFACFCTQVLLRARCLAPRRTPSWPRLSVCPFPLVHPRIESEPQHSFGDDAQPPERRLRPLQQLVACHRPADAQRAPRRGDRTPTGSREPAEREPER